jgi:hypothetical protein
MIILGPVLTSFPIIIIIVVVVMMTTLVIGKVINISLVTCRRG